MKIIVDAYGGDYAPLETIKGALQARDAYGVSIVLTGNEEEIRRIAAEESLSLADVEIVNATDVIGMNEQPKTILKEHKDCSMAVGLRLLHDGGGDAFVSAGSTGALLMGATFFVKRIKGVSRAALAAVLPSDKGPYMLLDSGANVDCRPEMLMQFASMGSLYMSEVMKNGEPATVGLLNVGTEEHKGGDLQHGTYELLKNSSLSFVGNVEARDVPAGAADVIVTDGFSGNVLLKTLEGTVDMLLGYMKNIFYTNLFTKIGALLVKPHLAALKKKLSTAETGGAPLLGVARPVIKAHGNSKALAIQNAVRVAAEFARTGVIDKITEAIASEKEKGDQVTDGATATEATAD
ncbi:MAG: phosphate acyltransferase PlsX [Clostridia bacterium]|nr:phosphate acyltransferase PlsX [Clostridia bacterium]